MSYMDDNLMPGETVEYRENLHWIIFLWPVLWLALAFALFLESENGSAGGRLALILAGVTSIGSFINYTTSEFCVTNKRVMIKSGFIKRRSLEINLPKVESVQVNQGILGRILDYGTIIVTGTGGSKEPFHKIDAPLEFSKKVQEQAMDALDALNTSSSKDD